MTVLEVRSGSEAFHETALSFLKEFAERKSCYADNGCPSKSVFNNSLEGHWANSLCTLDSQIILYAMKHTHCIAFSAISVTRKALENRLWYVSI